MPPSKYTQRKNAVIQKEQIQLLMIQKELEDILSKINDSINVLKVEELQLKSSAVISNNSFTIKTEKKIESPLQVPLTISSSVLTNDIPSTSSDWREQAIIRETAVNQQEIDLDLNNFYHRRHDIEEDDE